MKLVLTYVVMVAALAWVAASNNPNGLQGVMHGDSPLVLFGLPAFLCVYFLPSYIAVRRGHTNAVPIIIFNIFLGWTFVSWVYCLISACATIPPIHVVHQGNVQYDVNGRVDHYAHRQLTDDWGRPISHHD